MDFWTTAISAAERLGIPIVVLGVFLYGTWKIIKWVGENVIKPTVKSYVALVDETTASTKKNSDTLEQIGLSMDEKAKALTKIAHGHGEVMARMNEIHAAVTKRT
jgi:hypothetical protein